MERICLDGPLEGAVMDMTGREEGLAFNIMQDEPDGGWVEGDDYFHVYTIRDDDALTFLATVLYDPLTHGGS